MSCTPGLVGLPEAGVFGGNMEFLNNILDIILSIFRLLFVHDTNNPFYVISMFIVVSVITLFTLFRILKYHD